MKIDTRDLVSITDYSRRPAQYVKELADVPRRVILRNNQPAAVLMKIEDVQELEAKRALLDRLNSILATANGANDVSTMERVLAALEEEFGFRKAKPGEA